MRSVLFKAPHLQTWLAGMAISVFCLSGIAAVVVQIPSPFGSPAVGNRPALATSAAVPETRNGVAPVAERSFVRADCADCGSMESNRVVETHLAPARPAKLAAR
ncbi:MAG: hypothetical protein IPN98_05885 [Propionivibrio sp.]|nr:hypothetical protein [Propionivibrio sp.]